jgi:hypothetical protein
VRLIITKISARSFLLTSSVPSAGSRPRLEGNGLPGGARIWDLSSAPPPQAPPFPAGTRHDQQAWQRADHEHLGSEFELSEPSPRARGDPGEQAAGHVGTDAAGSERGRVPDVRTAAVRSSTR